LDREAVFQERLDEFAHDFRFATKPGSLGEKRLMQGVIHPYIYELAFGVSHCVVSVEHSCTMAHVPLQCKRNVQLFEETGE